jgi:hypothetical protein
MTLDSFGVGGIAVDAGVMILLSGGAGILFFYFWKKGRLDLDEEPKHQMMKDEEKL